MRELNFSLQAIQDIYQMLEDKESQEIYLARLNYLISGDIWHINNMIAKYASSFLEQGSGDDFLKLLDALPKNKDFILYGAGEDALKLLPSVFRRPNFAGFCCRTKEKQEKGYLGFPVMSPETLLARKDLSVVISTSDARDEIMQILHDGGYPEEMIYDGPAAYAVNMGKEEQYFGPEFMKFEEREVFVDAGCFDFGSSLALMKHCQHAKIYAFEPSAENYQLCLKRQRSNPTLADARLFQCGTWSEKRVLSFKEEANMVGSHVCTGNTGGYSVPVMPIDAAIEQGERVTMIKMDVEGSELESLKGAAQTIRRDKPKLAICIYHKPEDLWEIPLYIKELMPEYRFYIRHHSKSDSDTILYAIIPERGGE